MNYHLRLTTSVWIRRATLLLLGLLVLPLTACNAPRHTYAFATVAMESVDAETQAKLKVELADLNPGDHSDAALQRAAELLAQANAEAPTSAKARAAQALAIQAVTCGYPNEAHPAWLNTPAAARLRNEMSVAFDQADKRLKDLPPDLMTAIVWARTGIALDRNDELCAVIQRAATDTQLRSTLREDDATREQLWSHMSSKLDDSQQEVIYRKRDVTAGDVGNNVLYIVALPVLIIMLVLNGGDWCC